MNPGYSASSKAGTTTPSVIFRIPATTANLGPGFDLFGLALSLYNTIKFDFTSDANYELVDLQNQPLSIAPADNLIRIAYEHMYKKLGQQNPPHWRAVVDAATMPGKGFGSSAMAIVAGVHLAWALHQHGSVENLTESIRAQTTKSGAMQTWLHPETHPDEIQGFLDLEPHPDNVVPARVGGWVFCSEPHTVLRHNLPDSLGLAVVIPDYSISTEVSRMSLPASILRNDAISNIRGCLLWLEYIYSKEPNLLKQALQSDRLHEPYRTPGIAGYNALKEAAIHEGFFGMTLSGSGPGMILYFDRSLQKQLEARLHELILEHIGQNTLVKFCTPDPHGLVYLTSMS